MVVVVLKAAYRPGEAFLWYPREMDAFMGPNLSQSEQIARFDKLCDLCARIFDDDVTCKENTFRPHHDIYSLSKSAEANCHLCSLILGRILPNTVRHLQHDLDESNVAPSQQIGVQINDLGRLILEIFATSSPLPREYGRSRGDGWDMIGRLMIQTAEDNPITEARTAAVSNCSNRTILELTHWLRECVTSHTECFDVQTFTATRKVLPKRLLDLRFAAQEGLVRLIMSQSLPQDAVYATLSHCWGGQCEKTLTVESLKDFEEGLLVSSIPKTFQDAIVVTTKLSVSYLWVDALCIVQDSVDSLEWRQEASIMGDVYANSYFTLAATTSPNSQGGLLQQRNPLSVWPCRLTATWGCFITGELVVSVEAGARSAEMKPLGDRAWAFQEWVLSKRLIHFCKDQVRWECYCFAASEVNPRGVDELDYNYYGLTSKSAVVELGKDAESDLALWERIRVDYSEKALTKVTDKLAAFSGIARMVHKVLRLPEDNYLAGLWKQELLQELLWERYENERQPYHPDLYVAPTWSWASLNGPFWHLDSGHRLESHWRVNILETRISPVDDAFGPVKSGSLIVQCSLCDVTVTRRMPSDSNPRQHDWNISTINGVSVTCGCSVSLDHLPPAVLALPSSLSYRFMPMKYGFDKKELRYTEVTGLLLHMTQRVRGQYYRVGLFTVFLDGTDWHVVLSHLERRENLDANWYLGDRSDDLCAVEII